MKTVQIKLKPTKTQALELKRLSLEYIWQANVLVQQAISEEGFPKVTSKDIEADIPSVLKNELIRYAKSKLKQFGKCVFKKPMLSYNNQNFSVDEKAIRFPLMVEGKAKKTAIKAIIPEEVFALLSGSKLGALRITKKGFHWMAQISVHTEAEEFLGDGILGVDLGILCPAVGVVASNGKTQFFGNGRQNKCLRRKYKELRRQLGKKKKLNAIRNINDKESRIMRDINHKLSRQIVTFAVEKNCGTIHLEKLSGIRRTSRLRGKNKANLHSWTFHELSSFIEYKARELGIKVVYINPEYTSQICPMCGERNKVKDRNYNCGCGYHSHRDRVGALNIARTI
ncbi:transposase probable is891/is1136/is1341 [Trichococcus palustris]|jgi:putative transposase|uniref:Transposase probable is891/is1136/is1341 n=3 Tax=Trichococcus palustris TaxID=140314 RepID=A0A143Z0F6_9LACT|nr:transposase [Trichococcus palustris]CZR02223.1 transposase probable is891/is1136/is1341 [Trichococcus palustris]